MLFKKNKIINVLIFLIATGLGTIVHAQQQKPSERSFIVEMNKVKQGQENRNEKIRQLQKPSDSASVVADKTNSQQANAESTNAAVKLNAKESTTQNTQASSGASAIKPARTKPSQGPMIKPARSTRHQ